MATSAPTFCEGTDRQGGGGRDVGMIVTLTVRPPAHKVTLEAEGETYLEAKASAVPVGGPPESLARAVFPQQQMSHILGTGTLSVGHLPLADSVAWRHFGCRMIPRRTLVGIL